jgi:hypothetical protein
VKKWLPTLILVLAAGSQLGATDCGQIITDRGFDLWCGDQLCYWKLESGDVQKVPTWIDGDDGVEMVGDDVAISQMTPVTSDDTACIQFDMVADIDENAEVTLEADVWGDGTVDWSQRIPTSDWERQTLRIGFTGAYNGVRFRLRKQGDGHAILARIGAQTADDCPEFTALGPAPDGAPCSLLGDGCASGVCGGGTCGECTSDADCGTDVCGDHLHTAGNLTTWWECVPAGSHQLGEQCHSDEECATGQCDGEMCAECLGSNECAPGETCAPAAGIGVRECDPGSGVRASGAACVTDDDCTSGTCLGEPLGTCTLGDFRCQGDEECPQLDAANPSTCTFVAVAGGTCQ